MVRFTNLFATGIAAVLALGSGAVLTGCKSNDSAAAPAEKPAPAQKAAPAKPEPVKGAAAPPEASSRR